jgi:hypothetical protein
LDVSFKFSSLQDRACAEPGTEGWTGVIKNPGRALNDDDLAQIFEVAACADQNTGMWRFNLTILGLAYGTGLCTNNLEGKTDIGDGTGPAVTQENYCEILEWVSDLDPYQPYDGAFYSSNIIRLHESIHLDNEEFQLKFNDFGDFMDGISLMTERIVDCSESPTQAKERANARLRKRFADLMMNRKPLDDEKAVKEAMFQYFISLRSTIEVRAESEGWTALRPCN